METIDNQKRKLIKEALLLGINLKNQDINVKEEARNRARKVFMGIRSKSSIGRSNLFNGKLKAI